MNTIIGDELTGDRHKNTGSSVASFTRSLIVAASMAIIITI